MIQFFGRLWQKLLPLFWESIELTDLPQGYGLKRPIVLLIHRDSDEYVWVDGGWILYGLGPTIEDAAEDYALTLVEYYEMLRSEDLSVPMHWNLGVIRGLIIPPSEEDGGEG